MFLIFCFSPWVSASLHWLQAIRKFSLNLIAFYQKIYFLKKVVRDLKKLIRSLAWLKFLYRCNMQYINYFSTFLYYYTRMHPMKWIPEQIHEVTYATGRLSTEKWYRQHFPGSNAQKPISRQSVFPKPIPLRSVSPVV